MSAPRVARPSLAATVAVALLSLTIAGCGGFLSGTGLSGSGGRRMVRPTTRTDPVTAPATAPAGARTAGSPNELPSPPPPPERAPGAPSPVAAVTAFAEVYVNWSYRDVAGRMAMLARASIGQARSEMQLAAAQTARDSTIAQAGISNRGQVEGVAPLAGHAGEFVVVTRESTVAARSTAYQGLAPAWHVTLATAVPLATAAGRRWVVSSWQPES